MNRKGAPDADGYVAQVSGIVHTDDPEEYGVRTVVCSAREIELAQEADPGAAERTRRAFTSRLPPSPPIVRLREPKMATRSSAMNTFACRQGWLLITTRSWRTSISLTRGAVGSTKGIAITNGERLHTSENLVLRYVAHWVRVW